MGGGASRSAGAGQGGEPAGTPGGSAVVSHAAASRIIRQASALVPSPSCPDRARAVTRFAAPARASVHATYGRAAPACCAMSSQVVYTWAGSGAVPAGSAAASDARFAPASAADPDRTASTKRLNALAKSSSRSGVEEDRTGSSQAARSSSWTAEPTDKRRSRCQIKNWGRGSTARRASRDADPPASGHACGSWSTRASHSSKRSVSKRRAAATADHHDRTAWSAGSGGTTGIRAGVTGSRSSGSPASRAAVRSVSGRASSRATSAARTLSSPTSARATDAIRWPGCPPSAAIVRSSCRSRARGACAAARANPSDGLASSSTSTPATCSQADGVSGSRAAASVAAARTGPSAPASSGRSGARSAQPNASWPVAADAVDDTVISPAPGAAPRTASR